MSALVPAHAASITLTDPYFVLLDVQQSVLISDCRRRGAGLGSDRDYLGGGPAGCHALVAGVDGAAVRAVPVDGRADLEGVQAEAAPDRRVPTFDDPTLGPTTGKLDQFPLADEKKRARGPADSIADEDPLLIDPCCDTPALHLTFDATGAVSARHESIRGGKSIRVFGLDRKRLRDARRNVLFEINDLIEEQVACGNSRDRAVPAILQVLSRPNYRYSAFVSAIRDDPAKFGF